MLPLFLRLRIPNVYLVLILQWSQQFYPHMKAAYFFHTSITPLKPQTVSKRLPIHERLRKTKEELKCISKDYQSQLNEHHKLKLSYEKTQKKSMFKRIEFLKLYSTKKVKCEERELQEQRKRDLEWSYHDAMEQTKRRKLEQELQGILLRNEEEERVAKLQASFKKEKRDIQSQKSERHQKWFKDALNSHDTVRNLQKALVARRQSISASVSMRAKTNYVARLREEAQMIREYNNLMDQIGDFAQEVGLEKDLRIVDSNHSTISNKLSTVRKDNTFMTAHTIEI